MSVLEAATEAANRARQMDYPDEWDQERRVRALAEDAAFVSGVLLQILAQPRVSSELRTGTEWVPLDRELVE